jgi:uncharacterized protein
LIELKDYNDSYFDFVLSSNNTNEPQVGYLDKEKLAKLIAQTNYCKVAFFNSEPAGFLLCLPENISYSSMNYKWVSDRYSNFMYIDRISVLEKFQNEKIGTALYTDLAYFSSENKYEIILCEVNIQPPNPGSIRFHKKFDFVECGSQFTEGRTKEVQFFFKKCNK